LHKRAKGMETTRKRRDRQSDRSHLRAQVRVLVKGILRKHNYPPDKREKATLPVHEQAEVLSELWAARGLMPWSNRGMQ
ncbi:MAG: DUF3387 domain-containing protein, partial [Candidatus Eiseniibacteriota bacterium]